MGLSLADLSVRAGLESPLQLRVIFLGRGGGAVLGTFLGGWLCDRASVKVAMAGCILASAISVAMVPFAAMWRFGGVGALVATFAAVGLAGSAVVTCAVTVACWAFHGQSENHMVGPILQGCACAFGIAGAVLPICLLPAHGDAKLMYTGVAAAALAPLGLLLCSEAPSRPKQRAEDRRSSLATWTVALLAASAQFLLQGSFSSMVNFLVTFAQSQGQALSAASLLVSVVQAFATLGSLVTMSYGSCPLLDLACMQLLLATAATSCWALSTNLSLTWLAAAVYGFSAGPTLSYCNALFNEYTTPTAQQLALISLGTNLGASWSPFVFGRFMAEYGASSLLWCVSFSLAIVTLAMCSLRLYLSCWRRPSAEKAAPLLA